MTQQDDDGKTSKSALPPASQDPLVYKKLTSFAPECDAVKTAYDACFDRFFPRFLHGGVKEDPCVDKLKVYQECLRGALKVRNINLKEVDCTRMDASVVADMLDKR